MTATRPLLTLETLEPERPFITIDGQSYELAVQDDFGLLEQARLMRLMADAAALEEANRLEPGEGIAEPEAARDRELLARRATDLLDEAMRMVVRAPGEVLARLREPQKMAILQAFAPTVQAMAAPAMAPQDHRSRSTSGGSPRNSRRPTASVHG